MIQPQATAAASRVRPQAGGPCWSQSGRMLAWLAFRSRTRRMGVDVNRLEDKLTSWGYGLVVPVVFVASGITLDKAAILRLPLLMVTFVSLLPAMRQVPVAIMHANGLPGG